ncbi:MAG: hydratase [Clostridiales bacterium]|nr:hydratase [Clostridiales bacterium]
MKLISHGAYLVDNKRILDSQSPEHQQEINTLKLSDAKKGTIAYKILSEHNQKDQGNDLKIVFDSLTSHDITYVGIIQTARASGMTHFPVPYVMTNCHNSLCAVGGTINEDDHVFALSAARKYGGIFVPANIAVIHNYNREMMAGCGKMILGSDSHTRYGALGTIGIGEGGGELVKQLLSRTYDIEMPEIVGVYLRGKPSHGVGPQDVALALCKAVFKEGFVKNRLLEFVGEGIDSLSVEYRNGIDVMTTETACLSSIWVTDEKVREYYQLHGRAEDYKQLQPDQVAYYDRMIEIDLSQIRPMIALPFHPSNAMTIAQFKANAADVLRSVQDEAIRQFGKEAANIDLLRNLSGKGYHVDQGIIAGCSGGSYENIALAANILRGASTGSNQFALSVYPGSQPIYLALLRAGIAESLMSAGAILREAFCGPCFGAGDTPSNGAFSIRHTTRNFANREGSKPGEGQLSYVALMDARSIAATAKNGGLLTGADEVDYDNDYPPYQFDGSIYEKRVFYARQPDASQQLILGPNIKDWPSIPRLKEHLLVKVVSSINDPVTTTDELIPSGETSSYRSNPLRLAEFTLSRRDPGYVARAKEVNENRLAWVYRELPQEILAVLEVMDQKMDRHIQPQDISYGSAIFAKKPGDGSAREQAASSQRVLGGAANFSNEYATKRYRSNLINWGLMPFETGEEITEGSFVFIPFIRDALQQDAVEKLKAYLFSQGQITQTDLSLGKLTGEERLILVSGCLINHYKGD